MTTFTRKKSNEPSASPGCNFCHSKEVYRVFLLPDRFLKKTYELLECHRCHLHFINPMPTLGELKQLYLENYSGFTHFERMDVNRFNPWTLLIKRKFNFNKMTPFELFVSNLFSPFYSKLPKLNPPGKFLDVGCGDGFLITILGKWGWNTLGIEPMPAGFRKLSKRGLKVISSDFIEAKLRKNFFDVVNFSHVLEHTPNPKENLEKSFEVLKKDGWLCLEVPNFNCLQVKILRQIFFYDTPIHLYQFSPKDLITILKKIGFRNISFRTYTLNFLVLSYLQFKKRKKKENFQTSDEKINPLLRVIIRSLSVFLSQIGSGDCFEVVCQK